MAPKAPKRRQRAPEPRDEPLVEDVIRDDPRLGVPGRINAVHLFTYMEGSVVALRRQSEDGRWLPLFVGKCSPSFLDGVMRPGDRILTEDGQDLEITARSPCPACVCGASCNNDRNNEE